MYVILLYYIHCTYFERSYIYDTVSIPKTFHETQVCSLLSLSLIWRSPKFTPTKFGYLPTLPTWNVSNIEDLILTNPPFPCRRCGVIHGETWAFTAKGPLAAGWSQRGLATRHLALPSKLATGTPLLLRPVCCYVSICFLSSPKKGWRYTNRTIYLWLRDEAGVLEY